MEVAELLAQANKTFLTMKTLHKFALAAALIFSKKTFIEAFVATPRSSCQNNVRFAASFDEEDFDSYSRCMSPKQERRSVLSESQEYAIVDTDSRRLRPLQWLRRQAFSKLHLRPQKKPGKLILLLTGESTWHANNTFTGWADPSLTPKGIRTCQHASRLLVAEGLAPAVSVVYTSRLTRAIQSARTVLNEWNALYLPMYKTFRLNGRMYGAVQGLSKQAVVETFGASVVQAWRNTLKARPPALPADDPASPTHDRRYRDVASENVVLPLSESQLDCQERARPVWEHRIRHDLLAGDTVLVVAHKDSLRGIIQQVEGGTVDTTQLAFPEGVPVVYRFDQNLKPLSVEEDPRRMPGTKALFLEKPGLLAKALERQENWKNLFDDAGPGNRASTVEMALWKLRQEQQNGGTAPVDTIPPDVKELADEVAMTVETSTDANNATDNVPVERWADEPREYEDFEFFGGSSDEESVVGDLDPAEGDSESLSPALNLMPTPATIPDHPQDEPVVVLVRHGRTPHNNLGLFTGWEDPPLAEEGVEDAKRAGHLLKRHGFEFDVVYTSQLTRAIMTASHILDALGCPWLPLVKSWRLNERMYGALTGKSKRMIETEYGKEQLTKWRRGYKIKPPPVSSFSHNYPGNDAQRTKSVRDLPVSWSESIARSLEQRRLVIHRRFPKTESLHDCMKRSIPFYTQRIVKEAVQKNKRVLIASHENAIRGILMHLCKIPEEAMRQLHLPNGLPLVYSVKGKCITLLEDDLDDDVPKVTMEDFGPASKYLFQPCELTDDFFESMEEQQQMIDDELQQQQETQSSEAQQTPTI